MSAEGALVVRAPMKILMTADAVGGVWQYSLDLISRLGDDCHVLLATMGPRPSEAQKQRLSALRHVTLVEGDFKLEWMQRPWADVDAAGEWLLKVARDFRPDVIHLNGYAHATLPWQAPVLIVAHSCVYSWWQAVHDCAPPRNNWSEYHARVAAGLHAADAVAAPSAFMARQISEHYGLPAERIRVIHNFSEAPEYDGRAKQSIFVTAARTWDEAKNVRTLEQIANHLPWPVQIAANLSHRAVLERLQCTAVYVHPALYEPFGLAVLEAARAQCCLVLADIPSLRELWDGAAVFMGARDDQSLGNHAWIDVLTRIASDPEKRNSMALLARARARQYTATSCIDQYRRAYRGLRARWSAAA